MFDNRTVSRAITKEIAPMLRAVGFRTEGSRCFLRETDRTIVVLELLSCGSLRDRWNPSTAITAWYGVFFKEIGYYDDHRYPLGKLLASSCHTGGIPLKRGMAPRLWNPQAENIWLTQDEKTLNLHIMDLKSSIKTQIVDRLTEFDTTEFMVQTIEEGRDCLITRYNKTALYRLYGTPAQYRESLQMYLDEVKRLDEYAQSQKREPSGPNPRALPE